MVYRCVVLPTTTYGISTQTISVLLIDEWPGRVSYEFLYSEVLPSPKGECRDAMMCLPHGMNEPS